MQVCLHFLYHSCGTQDLPIKYSHSFPPATQDGLTPLHYCARAGHLEVVKLLVEAGASPGDKSVEGKTPIVLAVASEHVDVYNYLINKKHDSYKLLEDKKVRKQIYPLYSPTHVLAASIKVHDCSKEALT